MTAAAASHGLVKILPWCGRFLFWDYEASVPAAEFCQPAFAACLWVSVSGCTASNQLHITLSTHQCQSSLLVLGNNPVGKETSCIMLSRSAECFVEKICDWLDKVFIIIGGSAGQSSCQELLATTNPKPVAQHMSTKHHCSLFLFFCFLIPTVMCQGPAPRKTAFVVPRTHFFL